VYQPFNDSKHGRDQDDDAAGSEFGPNEIAGTGGYRWVRSAGIIRRAAGMT